MRPAFKNVVYGFLIFLLNFTLYADSSVATVERLRGEVTQLALGDSHARKLKVGDRLNEETSIVTGPRSFARIVFDDGTLLDVAPEAKMVLNRYQEDRPGVISLLRGALRTTIKGKTRDHEHQMYIRTRSAALGVRGTDFQVSYRPENDITSTLTYTGEVSKSYVDERDFVKRLGQTQKQVKQTVERTNGHNVRVREVEIRDSHFELDDLFENSLKSDQVVQVQRGQYSGTVKRFKRTSLPVRVSPVQLKALYENDEFELKEREIRSIEEDEIAMSDTRKTWPSQAPQTAPAEGLLDARRGLFAPKAGGFIDFNTGLYIPPDEKSSLNRERGVYIPSRSLGSIDADTGQYVPPQGLLLDPKLGFVVSPSADEGSDIDGKLIAMRESLNHNMATDIVLPSIYESALPQRSMRILSLREQLTKDIFDFRLGRGGQRIRYKDDPDRENILLDDASFTRFDVDWYHASGGRFQVFTGLSYSSVDVNKQGQAPSHESDSLLDLRLGSRYYLSSRWSLRSSFILSQNHFVNFVDVDNVEQLSIERTVIPKLSFGVDGELVHALEGRLRFGLLGEFSYSLKKNGGDFEVSSGPGVHVELYSRYWVSPAIWGQLGVYSSYESYDLTSPTGPRGKQSFRDTGVLLSVGMAL